MATKEIPHNLVFFTRDCEAKAPQQQQNIANGKGYVQTTTYKRLAQGNSFTQSNNVCLCLALILYCSNEISWMNFPLHLLKEGLSALKITPFLISQIF
jgi:hypothetical protein